MSQISKYYIQNSDNYNKQFEDTSTTIFAKYMIIINEYLKQCLDNIFIQNPTYQIYVIKRGITTINNVFKLLLMYTKNLDITYYNCQKSYIYYIEFIGQIGDDNHSFLQLNSKDASLFVYKKTIFDINNDIRKDYVIDNVDSKVLYEVNLFIKIYNVLLCKLIENNKIIDVIKYVNTDLQNVMNKLIKLGIEAHGLDISSKLTAIFVFSTYFKKDNIFDYLDIFVKKIKKKNIIFISQLELYLLDEELYNTSPVKYINLLMNNICIRDTLKPEV